MQFSSLTLTAHSHAGRWPRVYDFTTDNMLTITDLSKSYTQAGQRQQLFAELALDVRNAEVVALLGTSGSGKTTLLNLISGIDDPDSGTVTVNGTDIHALGEPHRTLFRRNQIGFIFQFFNLIPTLTVGENIALPLELTGTEPGAVADRVTDLLRRVGLENMPARYPETLSGGEQQRIAVARALAHRPKLLLADEPTGNLDEATGASVIDLLGELARDQNASLLVVTHSDRVARVADRVLRLDRGQLLAA
jgi:putative ABC transport system ATP-binding protein